MKRKPSLIQRLEKSINQIKKEDIDEIDANQLLIDIMENTLTRTEMLIKLLKTIRETISNNKTNAIWFNEGLLLVDYIKFHINSHTTSCETLKETLLKLGE